MLTNEGHCKSNAYENILFPRPGDDWKKNLKLPPKDMRMKTSVGTKCLNFVHF